MKSRSRGWPGLLSPGLLPGRVTCIGLSAGLEGAGLVTVCFLSDDLSTAGLEGAGLVTVCFLSDDLSTAGLVTAGLVAVCFLSAGFVTAVLTAVFFVADGLTVEDGLTVLPVLAGLVTTDFCLLTFDLETAGLEVVVREVVELVERLAAVPLLF